jgi:hypothetical protein
MPSWAGYVAVALASFFFGVLALSMFAATAVVKLQREIDRLRHNLHVLGED